MIFYIQTPQYNAKAKEHQSELNRVAVAESEPIGEPEAEQHEQDAERKADHRVTEQGIARKLEGACTRTATRYCAKTNTVPVAKLSVRRAQRTFGGGIDFRDRCGRPIADSFHRGGAVRLRLLERGPRRRNRNRNRSRAPRYVVRVTRFVGR